MIFPGGLSAPITQKVPTSVEHGKLLDKKNNNHFWMYVLAKEMANVCIVIIVLEHSQATPVGWKQASGHLILDVKLDFTRKASWTKDGDKTTNPLGSDYSGGVVSRESVRITFTYAALNNFNIWAADIQIVYIQAQNLEKHHIIWGS